VITRGEQIVAREWTHKQPAAWWLGATRWLVGLRHW